MSLRRLFSRMSFPPGYNPAGPSRRPPAHNTWQPQYEPQQDYGYQHPPQDYYYDSGYAENYRYARPAAYAYDRAYDDPYGAYDEHGAPGYGYGAPDPRPQRAQYDRAHAASAHPHPHASLPPRPPHNNAHSPNKRRHSPSTPPARQTRMRSSSPTPPPPPPLSPTPSYLSLSLAPSAPESPPPRKLLILDLNGSLVIRAARKPHGHGGAPQAVRAAHPRPYMAPFRAWLAHESTRAWLDVMVWSSAQAHSVADMVDKAFGEDKSVLCAVWARDSLGLSAAQFHTKVQTVKDLRKPWAQLPRPATPPSSPRPDSRPASPRPPAHSARTTVLLDDSPLKAVLQPFNHLCLPEYTQPRRNADLALLARERAAALLAANPALAFNPAQVPSSTSTSASTVTGDEGGEGEGEGEGAEGEDSLFYTPPPGAPPRSAEAHKEAHKAKRRARKERRRRAAALALKAEAEGAAEKTEQEETEDKGPKMDRTLLAVTGVLDALKGESNVAGWVRAGGLWPLGPPSSTSAPVPGNAEDGNQAAAGERGDGEGEGESRPMWFEDERTFREWERRGRAAMRALGIAVEHGLRN